MKTNCDQCKQYTYVHTIHYGIEIDKELGTYELCEECINKMQDEFQRLEWKKQ